MEREGGGRRETCKETYIPTGVERERDRDRDKDRETETDRQTERDSERETDRETETDTQRETETERQRQRDRETETDRETERTRNTHCVFKKSQLFLLYGGWPWGHEGNSHDGITASLLTPSPGKPHTVVQAKLNTPGKISERKSIQRPRCEIKLHQNASIEIMKLQH